MEDPIVAPMGQGSRVQGLYEASQMGRLNAAAQNQRDEERRLRELQEEEKETHRGEAFSAGFVSQNTVASVAALAESNEDLQLEAPKEFNSWLEPTPEGQDWLAGVPREFYPMFRHKTWGQGMQLKKQIANEMAGMATAEDHLWSYLAGSVTGAIVSPENMFAIAAISKTINAAKAMNRVHKLQTISKVAGIGMGTAAVQETALLNTQATRTVDEAVFNVLAAGAIDMTLGSVAATLSKTNRKLLEAEMRASLEIGEVAPRAARHTVVENFVENGGEPRHAGAAQAVTTAPGQASGAEIARGKGLFRMLGMDKAVFGLMKVTPTGRLLLSDNPETRKLAQELVETNLRMGGDGFIPSAVETSIKRYEKDAERINAEVFGGVMESVVKSGRMTKQEFMERVDNHLRQPLSSGETDVDIINSAKRIADNEASLWREAFDAEIPGSFRYEIGDDGSVNKVQNIAKGEGYAVRMYDAPLIQRNSQAFKDDLAEQWKAADARIEADVKAEMTGLEGKQLKLLEEVEELSGRSGWAEDGAAKMRLRDEEADALREMATEASDPIEIENLLRRARDLEASRPTDMRGAIVAEAKVLRTRAKEAADNGWDKDSVKLGQAADRLEAIAKDIGVLRDKWFVAKRSLPKVKSAADLEDALEDTYRKIARTGFYGQDAAPSATGAGRFKKRMDIDEQAMSRWLVKDPELAHAGYARSVGARVAMAKQFGDVELEGVIGEIRNAYKARRAALKEELPPQTKVQEKVGKAKEALGAPDRYARELRKLEKQEAREINDIEKLRDLLLGRGVAPTAMQPENKGILTALRAARSWNVATMLGGVTISSLPDAGRVLAYDAASKVAPAITKAVKNIRLGDLPKQDAALIASITERYGQGRMAVINDTMWDGAPINAVDKAAKTVSEKAMTAFGMRHWNSIMKGTVGILADSKIAESIWKGTHTRELRRLGIDDAMAQRIKAQMSRFDEDTLRDGALWMTRMEEWDDVNAVRAVEMAIIKEADSVVMTPGVGDKMLIANTEVGKSIFQFKSFVLAAVNRIVAPNLQSDMARGYREVLFMTALGGLSYAAAETAAGRTPSSDPRVVLKNAIDRTGLLAYMGEAYNIQAKLTGIDPFGENTRYRSRDIWGALGGPTIGTVSNLVKAGNINSSTDSRVHAIRAMIPGQNLSILRRGFNEVERQTAVALGGHGGMAGSGLPVPTPPSNIQ